MVKGRNRITEAVRCLRYSASLLEEVLALGQGKEGGGSSSGSGWGSGKGGGSGGSGSGWGIGKEFLTSFDSMLLSMAKLLDMSRGQQDELNFFGQG